MSIPELAEIDRRTRSPSGAVARRFIRVVTFGRLEAISLCHSCIYVALLVVAFGFHNTQPATTILGFAHGILWIVMSLVCLIAARLRIIPYWLAVAVVVLGGIGPFFGSVGFIVESRRRALGSSVERMGARTQEN